MKKRGSTSDFICDRNRELHGRFIELLRGVSEMPLRDMFGVVAVSAASRFWVSESRAVAIVGKMLRGEDVGRMYPKRLEMYEEISRRVKKLMTENPGLCLTHAVNDVVYQEAPEFYMTAESVRTVIYRMRRQARAMRKLRAGLARRSTPGCVFDHCKAATPATPKF